ncbi:MAG TPA: DUF5694 domain-containing protein [Ignavibacteriaceae bacterium]|nr:DUF5694 domain-containing protein [Ignavibacteriaceae bacterium]
MKALLILLCGLFISNSTFGQSDDIPPQTKIMTLGVFHFAYPNLDAVKTDDKDKISVLEEPYQSEIIAISVAISDFNPTIIAVEWTPDNQPVIDSLYLQYKADRFVLGKNEIHQLGFRIGKHLNLDKIYCVDDWGRHYENIEAIFNDSVRLSKFEDYYLHSRDTIYGLSVSAGKVTSIIDELYKINRPEYIKERLSGYLLHPFKYEEQPGDFTGVDFESGRWYNRNLRIFRNIQRIPYNSEDRILLIIGSEHLNLLNLFFDTSREFELVSPLPYLEKARLK